jgi:nucleotide-binding universal stress UspA family protein
MFATDLTENSKAILPIAASIAEKAGAEIETLVVFGEGDVRPGTERGREILTNFFTEANALNLFGVVVRATGGVGESVVEEATAMQTDLIAIATSICCGGNPELTDTAEFIIRNAPCPVLCVNPCT